MVIATYNQPDYLQIVLESVLDQTTLPGEVVIGDDGSGNDTIELVRRYKKNFPVPLTHVWQPNEGFRAGMVRNNAVSVSTGNYLIFLDGDCYLNKYFIEDHVSFAELNRYVVGTRVNIKPRRKNYILRTGNRNVNFFSCGTTKKFHAIRSKILASFRHEGGIMGANMACWRDDFERINGFNERFSGYSGEDGDFTRRLENAGIKRKKMVHLGIAYHFDHPPSKRNAWYDGSDSMILAKKIAMEEPFVANIGYNRAVSEGVKILD